ncbi:MBOAT family O-acyltransferase [Gemmata sp. JC717]|uniref:MBOAT family O-acyltransferase n=1 Tax=Gemmata algarum TaxID=2975278 RepID=UPI0021BA6D3F|nr:MBOAT family O-acyltransferase [Gemmata algarum]MDY3551793.1 MBOAT family O-acyltransferase [Gemmata algarum]
MLFLTYWFVLFALVLFPIYWAVPYPPVRRLVLLAGSVVFHTHFAGPAGVLPIAALGLVTYLGGLSRSRLACRALVGANVLALVYYKYAMFLSKQVLGAVWPEVAEYSAASPYLKDIIPPLAISFFVFEYVHYLLDVGGGSEPLRDPVDFALFSVFWPSIVAGPVKRYQEFVPALEEGLAHTGSAQVCEGLLRVALGYAKKVVADNLTAYIAFATARYDQMTLTWRWFLVLCIGMRILLDFSGYTDIAVGYARMHGVRLPENFNWPYLSRSIGEFWRRWHMSLSRWIRDYVYITLGGNRRGVFRTAANGLLTFALCGLWHGAGYNFLVWGVLHGLGLAVAGNYRRLWWPGRALGWVFDKLPPLGWALTTLFVFLAWLFFFYPVPQAAHMIHLLLPEKWR